MGYVLPCVQCDKDSYIDPVCEDCEAEQIKAQDEALAAANKRADSWMLSAKETSSKLIDMERKHINLLGIFADSVAKNQAQDDALAAAKNAIEFIEKNDDLDCFGVREELDDRLSKFRQAMAKLEGGD